MKTSKRPTQSMGEFFHRPDVKATQETMKRFPYGSQPHRAAFAEMRRLADLIGAGKYIGNYED